MKPGRNQPPLGIQPFEPNEKLCIINCLKEYKPRTDLLSANLEGTPQQLILPYSIPQKPVNSRLPDMYNYS